MPGTPLAMPSIVQSAAERDLLGALRESEECFRSAFEHAAIGMAVVALDGRWMRVNRTICEIVGYSEQQLLATDFQSLTHPDDLDLDLEYVRRLIAGEIRTYQMTKRYVRRDGRIVWVLLSVSLVRGERRQPLYFISQIQDITESKATEEALLQSEAKFRQVVNQAADGVFVHDLAGKILDVNLQGCHSLGYSREELIGRSLFDLEIGCAPKTLLAGWRALRAGDTQTVKGLHRRKDGTTFPVEVRIGLLEIGGVELIVGLARDVSDRVRHEAVERDRLEVLELIAKGCSAEEGTTRLAAIVEQRMPGSVAAFLALCDGGFKLVGSALPELLRQAILARPLTVSTELCDNAPADRRPTCHDFGDSSCWEHFRATALQCGLGGCWAFLIEGMDGAPLGVFAVFTPRAAAPVAWERRLCDAVSNLAALTLERNQLADNLARRAFYDALTGCCNRALFNERFLEATERAAQPGGSGALLLMDLDHFKQVNDAFGHDAGDELLQQFAQRVRGVLREEDTLARLGGDEFTILLPAVRSREDLASIAAGIARALRPPFPLRSGPLQLTSSIGGCIFPTDGTQPDALLKAADRALYRVKSRGRDGADVGPA
jgi:diguanylate cyclase (GGDEF)-like protein/PAS domain S-box-containing protein